MSVTGSAVVVGVYDEVTYKSSSGVTSGRKAYFTECGLVASRNLLQPNTISGDRSRALPLIGNLDVSGSLNIEVSPEQVGFYLRHAIGAPTTTGADPYVHTFRPGTLPVGLIVEKNWVPAGLTGKVEHFLGCRIGQATFDIPTEGPCTLNMSLQGANYAIASAPLDAAQQDAGHTGFASSDCTVLVGGASTTCVKQASIAIDNTLDGDRYCIGGGGVRKDIPEGFAEVTGSITALFEAFTLVDAAMAGTDTTLELLMSRGDGLGSAGNESLSIKLDHARLALASPAISSPGGVEVTFEFTGYKSGATDKPWWSALKNAQAATTIS
ncbi:MAG: hypothetical protein IPN19_15365 [Elusimicrobia bacterium]|nr:hypothetical protein [Elusimicrobiota bacterium]